MQAQRIGPLGFVAKGVEAEDILALRNQGGMPDIASCMAVGVVNKLLVCMDGFFSRWISPA